MGIFKFVIGEEVKLGLSDEQGVVIGRAEMLDSDPIYLVRMVTAADRSQCETWFAESAIVSCPTANDASPTKAEASQAAA